MLLLVMRMFLEIDLQEVLETCRSKKMPGHASLENHSMSDLFIQYEKNI